MYSERWNYITSTIILNCVLLLDVHHFLKPNRLTAKDTFLKYEFPVPHLSSFYQSSTKPKGWGVGINLSRKRPGSGSTIGGLAFVVAGPPSLCPFCILWHVLHSQGHCKSWWLRQVQNTQPGGPHRRVEGCAVSPCPHFKPPGFTVQKVAKERSVASSSGLHHHTRTESSTISHVAQSANTFQISMRTQLLIPTLFSLSFLASPSAQILLGACLDNCTQLICHLGLRLPTHTLTNWSAEFQSMIK